MIDTTRPLELATAPKVLQSQSLRSCWLNSTIILANIWAQAPYFDELLVDLPKNSSMTKPLKIEQKTLKTQGLRSRKLAEEKASSNTEACKANHYLAP